MPYQSTSNFNAFVLGSARISVPSSSGGYVHLGAARGIKITESWDKREIEIDNAANVQLGITNQTVMVEGNLLELNLQKIARMRNGIDTFSTTTFTFDSGGNMTVTPQAFYLIHVNPIRTSETLAATIYYASVDEPLSIPFPSDDGSEAGEIPFKIKGMIQSSRTTGQQLFSIVDTRTLIYSTDAGYASTAP